MSTALRTAQAFVVITPAVLSGANFSYSYLAMPGLQHSPTPLMLRQWRIAFKRGKATVPPVAMTCLGVLSYLSYNAYHLPPAASSLLPAKWRLFALAGLATGSTVFFTILAMTNTNDALEALEEKTQPLLLEKGSAAQMGSEDEATARKLLDKWTTLNFTRALFPLTGAVLAFLAASV